MNKNEENENPLNMENTEYKPIQTIITKNDGRKGEEYERR